MGKVAGNLNTELIVDYLVRKKHYDYEFEDILDMIDDYIYKYSLNHKWGYSTPAMLAGVYKSHPNNIIYLTEKFRLDTKDIGKLLSMIDPLMRQRYDYDNIRRLYTEYVADKVDDYNQIEQLKKKIEGKEVFVMVPGNSLNTHRQEIDTYILENYPIVISVNFVTDYSEGISFFGNAKRYSRLKEKRNGREVIISSNVKSDTEQDIVVNYHSIINRGYKYFENSTIMLLSLLKRVNPKKVTMAGFDGFEESAEMNYSDSSFQNERHVTEFDDLNDELMKMFGEIVETMSPACVFDIITPSKFKTVINSNRNI